MNLSPGAIQKSFSTSTLHSSSKYARVSNMPMTLECVGSSVPQNVYKSNKIADNTLNILLVTILQCLYFNFNTGGDMSHTM